MNRQLAASVSGLAATLPMSAVMLALKNALPDDEREPLPPKQITENAASQAGVDDQLNESHRQAATAAAHFGYGAVAGAGYGALAGKSGLPAAAEGALYGLAVWGGSYLGLMPATGLYRSATEEPAARNALMIAAHVVWGGALGMIFELLTQTPASERGIEVS